jgi:cytochrome c553
MPDRSARVRLCALLIAGLALLGALRPQALRADPIDDKAVVCGGCHGENGVPQDRTMPVIWGQKEGYLYLQLRDYKSGDRKNDIMQSVVADFSRDDMFALAAYFAKKAWPDLQQPRAPADIAAIAARDNGSIGCTGCHQDGYRGDGTQPRLAGQTREYLQQTMLDFRTRKRGNNPGMSDLMTATPQDDFPALAQYLAGL